MPPYNTTVRSDFDQMSQGKLEGEAEKGTLMQHWEDVRRVPQTCKCQYLKIKKNTVIH